MEQNFYKMTYLPPEALGLPNHIPYEQIDNKKYAIPPEALGLSPFDGETPIPGVTDKDIVKNAQILRNALKGNN